VVAGAGLPEDTIVTNGVGAYAGWSQRYFQHHSVGSQLGPISGSMGYGLPAALAAKLARPDSIVVALAGDGCFMMTSEELATAVKNGIKIVVLVVSNNMFGTISIHEETKLDGRTTGADLSNPNFVAFAKSFGASGESVTQTAEFEPAFERAVPFPGPALIELLTDPNAINTRYSLGTLQEQRQSETA
jgi:acetolactate synthase I/II/III large subunit